jgi:spore maturation protein SpmB
MFMKNSKRKEILQPITFLAVLLLIFGAVGSKMGMVNMLSTLMNTAYELLLDTVFYIMAVAVVAGALSALLSEFGVVSLINKILSPLMKPLFGLPGAASLGILTTYLSDNPAILALAHDKGFRRYFKKYQLPALTNLGTAFGMGVIVTTFMMGLQSPKGESFLAAALIGNLGAVVGSIVSSRLMLLRTAKVYGKTEPCDTEAVVETEQTQQKEKQSLGMRIIDCLMSGGKSGVTLGMDVIPGVLIICSLVLMFTNGPSAAGTYTGAAYEGIGLLPWIGDKLSFILRPLFGFSSAQGIAVPITALGSAGAAIGLIPELIKTGAAGAGDIAVFTAMCMCWSGYLSTHVAMMDNLKCSKLTGHAILSHTIGGLCAGVAANWIFKLIQLF